MATVMPIKKKVVLPGDETDDGVQKTAMSQLAEGLAGPSQGLETSIGQGRSAVAQFAKDTQRQAAQTAVKNGALGQGTQNGLAQGARQSVMTQLGTNEANNAKMVSDEHKGFLDKALDIGQQNKQLQQNQNQFDVTSGQTQQQINNQASQFQTTAGQEQQKISNQASQFKTTSGQTQQQIDAQKDQFSQTLATNKDQFDKTMGMENTKLIATLGADIPGIATKVMTTALGQNGTPLTDSEKADLSKWYDDAKAKGDKMDAQMDTLINKMVSDATAPKSAMTTLAENTSNDQLTADTINKKLASGGTLTPDEAQAGIKANAFPQYTLSTIPMGDNVQGFLQKNPNGIVNLGGQPYKIISGQAVRTGAGTFSNQARHTDVVQVEDPQGKTKYIYNGKLNDALPKQVNNDWTPFGF